MKAKLQLLSAGTIIYLLAACGGGGGDGSDSDSDNPPPAALPSTATEFVPGEAIVRYKPNYRMAINSGDSGAKRIIISPAVAGSTAMHFTGISDETSGELVRFEHAVFSKQSRSAANP